MVVRVIVPPGKDAIIFTMFLRSVAAILFLAATVTPAWSQSNARIGPDLRIFAMTAALNAAGFDGENRAQYLPVRADVRKFATAISPDLARRMKAFYASNKADESDEAQLTKYVALAVALTDPPDLKLSVREPLLGDGARSVLGFVDLLREFCQQVRITERWSEFRPRYESEADALGPKIRDLLFQTQGYLLLNLAGDLRAGSLAFYVELAAPLNSVTFFSTIDDYHVVLGGAVTPRMDEIRHAYFHYILDGLVLREIPKIENGTALLALASKEEGVQHEFTRDLHLMVTESLIRALELRMDHVPAATARTRVDGDYRTGLLLTPYFYDGLAEFELQDSSIRDYLPKMTTAIQVKEETKRFNETFRGIALPSQRVARSEVPKVQAPPPVDPLAELLKEGQIAFNAGQDVQARIAFEKALARDGNNGSALYGLALIASKDGDSEIAGTYFQRALASDSTQLSMKVWAHIYLGRISDLDCKRADAIAHYSAAIKTGDDTKSAQSAARQGVDKPFGDACR
jgi:tetratricopeptide (TPR) repeat protein